MGSRLSSTSMAEAGSEVIHTAAIPWGVSAGGHFAALANVTCNIPELAPWGTGYAGNPDSKPDEIVNAEVTDCVQGALSWYGVFDMVTIDEQARKEGAMSRDVEGAPGWALLSCFKTGCSANIIRLSSPVSFVDSKDAAYAADRGR